MKHVLEAVEVERGEIQATIAECEARLAKLDDIAKLAGAQPEPAKPKPRQRRQTPRGLPPVSRTQQQQGRPRAPRASEEALAARVREIHGLIRELEPVRTRDLVAKVSYGDDGVRKALYGLELAGLVRATGTTNDRRWNLTETLDREVAERNGSGESKREQIAKGQAQSKCREDVLATIRSEPGKWTEQRIADTRAFDREDVADACGALLSQGWVSLDGDGTYWPVQVSVGGSS